jgi:hypothetical protein
MMEDVEAVEIFIRFHPSIHPSISIHSPLVATPPNTEQQQKSLLRRIKGWFDE